MISESSRPVWRSWKFFFRLALGYLLAPLAPPILFIAMFGSWGRPSTDWRDSIALYWPFGFAAILVLGTPLLCCFLGLNWTGSIPFGAAGGVCAACTVCLVLRPPGFETLPVIELFAVGGILSGFLLRVILFGFREPGTS